MNRTSSDLPPLAESPTLTLAEINTIDLLKIAHDAQGQSVVTLQRSGRELDLDALGHFMDLSEQARGPWIPAIQDHEAQAAPAQSWRQTLNTATVLHGAQAQAVQNAMASLNTLQASLPALIERLREAVGEHEAQKQAKSLSSLFRAR